MQLFAIVAKEGGVSSEERTVVEYFLRSQLNQDAVKEYMSLFEEFVDKYTTKDDGDPAKKKSPMASVKESARTLRICMQINKELTQKQKFVVVYRLMELIMADEEITEQEDEFIITVYQTFNISDDEYSSIKQFVIHKEPTKLDLPNILIINSDKDYKCKTGKHMFNESITGFIAVLRIHSVEMYLAKYCGETTVYLNGLGLNFNQVYTFASGSTIRFAKATPIYYSDIVSRFLREEATARTTFEAFDIEYKFPNGNIGLRGINVAEESGKLIGLMGASGAGKTTLLGVLNGNETPSKGKVLINGIDIHNEKDKIEGVIGYVPQDDLLIEDLSVYQNLYFAAKLCFKELSEMEIDKLVLKTLTSLGLIETRNLKVGSPLKKTISGGQRKRLNIGLELLREPSVLFLDEPTSGLSSRDSENILDLLKELSLRGKLIFVVIHQPSSEIFKMFDKLVILDVGGYPVYYGNPVEAVIFFKKLANQINAGQGECI
ncbi:MAG: ATP-binding cassette domain-containing protein, partial [Bacteroidia bacterium]|nr:ATP-binding cassette domain-containing protein [Bacteroidia bacterium]